jgi:hypothetical protein
LSNPTFQRSFAIARPLNFALAVGWLDEVFRFAVVAGFGDRLWLFDVLRFTVCAGCLFRVRAWWFLCWAGFFYSLCQHCECSYPLSAPAELRFRSLALTTLSPLNFALGFLGLGCGRLVCLRLPLLVCGKVLGGRLFGVCQSLQVWCFSNVSASLCFGVDFASVLFLAVSVFRGSSSVWLWWLFGVC